MAQDTLISIDKLASDRELKQFGSVSVTPAENPDWAYQLILPKTWVQDEDFERAVPKFDEMVQIGLFGAPDAPVGLQVWATAMPFEVDLLDWLKMMVEDGEMELEEIAVRSPDTGQCVEALVNVLHGNKTQLIRLTALSNGNKIYFLNGVAEEIFYKSFIKPLSIAAVSFMPLKPSDEDLMEKVILVKDKTGHFKFNYPASWNVEDISPDSKQAALSLKLAQDNELLGYLRVQSLSTNFNTQNVLGEIKLNLESSGVSTTSFDPIKSGDWNCENIWGSEATVNGNVNECVIAIKPFNEGGDAVKQNRPAAAKTGGVAMVLLLPERERNTYGWMRCKRALEIAIATARPSDAK